MDSVRVVYLLEVVVCHVCQAVGHRQDQFSDAVGCRKGCSVTAESPRQRSLGCLLVAANG